MEQPTPIEDRLLYTGVVRLEQLEEAKTRARQRGKSVWSELVRAEALTEEELYRFFGVELGISFILPSQFYPNYEFAYAVGEELARENELLPMFVVDQVGFVAMANPSEVTALDEIGRKTGYMIEPLIAPPSSIHSALDKLYGIRDRCGEALAFAEPQRLRGIGTAETREHPRSRMDFEVRVSLVTSSIRVRSAQPMHCQTEDLSIGGAKLRIPCYLPKGTEISMAIPMDPKKMDGAQGVLHLRARVMHCFSSGIRETVLSAGVQFMDVAPEARGVLERMLSYL